MTFDVSTIDEFNNLQDADKAEIIHFLAVGVLVTGAIAYDVAVTGESLGFDESRVTLTIERFQISNIVAKHLIRRVVVWMNNSMQTMVSDITTAMYE